MNLLIRRCFEPDSIAFMKPTAVLGVVVVAVDDFVSVDVFDSIGVDGSEEGEEELSEESDADDVNGMMTVPQVPIYPHKPIQGLRTCSRKPRLSAYTNQCAVIYLF